MLPQRTNASATILCLLMVVILNIVYGVEQESVQQLQMICSNKFVHIGRTGIVHANDSSDHPQTITIMSDIPNLLQRPKKIPIKLFVKDVNMYLCFNKVWRLIGIEKRNIGRHHHCDFYEEESRGYFRFQSADDAKRYMSFFKRSGKPYQENQLRPKKVCSEFVKAHLQPVYNTGPGYSIFNVMPHHHRPVATTTAAPPPPTTTRLTTTTPTTLRPTITTHKFRHQHHHQQQQQKKKKEQSSSELATQEFSSGQETRHIRHHQKQQAATQAKRKNPKKRPGHKRAGQGAGGGGGGGGGALSRARGGGRKAVQQAPPPKQRDNPEILYLDEEELRQERIRALALEEEKARQRKEQRLAEFAMVDDYWNDDNMILSEEGPVWEVMRPEQKRASRQPAAARTSGGKGKPQDSILLNRLSEKRRGSSSSSEFKTQPGDRRTKTMPLKRLFAAPSKGNGSGSSSNTSNYRSMNSKKIASNPHDRLNNHHHHPNAKSRES